jgi:uncharacterized UPF0146 family protein
MLTYIRHRVVQQVLVELGLGLAQKSVSMQIAQSGITVTVFDIVVAWAGFSSVKSYQNKLKVLRLIDTVASMAHPTSDYINRSLFNLSRSKEILLERLTSEEPYPVGYLISWPELTKAVNSL